ncbi:MAG: cysteine--tRNA ligase [Cenarchaeum symbiont of Oopsacas minuta]|nr:cysteine--tRNA ligase [Cenarchaeum symbiont of Oopsacas minuta]
MKISDTMSGEKNTIDGDKVSIYLCGITVYDESHIGHARTIIIFDILSRHLESNGTSVRLVQNFTDIDDKIILRAIKEDTTVDKISEKYIQDYYDCFDALHVKRASEYPCATKHILDMIEFISKLVEKNAAYVTENGVYFAVDSFSKYGRLSKKNIKELQAGSRIKVDEHKKNYMDFALWKNSKDEPLWNSPWGKGRPGWHIECSAMCQKYLGDTFDIHGGGRDLIFPHHENELAQSESVTGIPMAKTWMHVGMVTINGEKMSKSAGNTRSITRLLREHSPNVIRMFCLGVHYSKPVDYTLELLDEHRVNWNRIRLAYHMLLQCTADSKNDLSVIKKIKNDFDAALDDDLNTHEALTALNKLATHCIGLGFEMSQDGADEIIPIFESMLSTFGLTINIPSSENIAKINQMIDERNKLRKEEKYTESDTIRDELQKMNIEIKDDAWRTLWLVKDKRD